MKSFFIGFNKRDEVMVDIYTKTKRLNGKVSEDVWATANIDFLLECRPGGDDLMADNKDIECVMITREEYEELLEQANK